MTNIEPGLVSVIIATYNCEQYVTEAIRSVLSQTYPTIEVHVVDDGSTDGTERVVAPFLADPRVRYYKQANAGQTVAKNRGIAVSRGEFIGFCDADDTWLPEKLAIQVPKFSVNDHLGVVYTGAARMGGGPRNKRLAKLRAEHGSGRITADLFKTNFIPFGTALVRRRCLAELGAFDERYRMGIDWELWLRLSTRYEFLYVDTVTQMYRHWPGQMSNNWRGRYEYAFRIMTDFLATHPGLIDPAVVREAWADSYANRAQLRSESSGEHLRAFADLLRAIGFTPFYGHAWRTLAVVLLTAAKLRR